MNLEKQLTRIFKSSTDESAEPEEKAISVISRESVRFTGSAINKYDIMNNPGSNIISVNKVGDNLIALTPYSIFVNHGGASAHNTKEYSINYTMLGNTHHICTNDKDTIMHTTPDNKVVLFILITEDGINETNITPCQDAVIYNSWCIYASGDWGYYLLTDLGIYYLNSVDGVIDYTKEWTNVADSFCTTNAKSYSSNNPIIGSVDVSSSSNDTNYAYTVTILNNSNSTSVTFEYTATYQGTRKAGALIPLTNSAHTFAHLTGTEGIFEFENIGYRIRNTLSLIARAGYYTNSEDSKNYYRFSILKYNHNSSPTLIYKLDSDIKKTSTSKVYIFNLQGMALSTDDSESNTIYNNGDVWIVDGSVVNRYILTYDTSPGTGETPVRLKANGTIQLLNDSVTIFNPEPSFCFHLKARDVGDEIKNTEKVIYYNTDGRLDFYTGDYNIHGMFYTFEKFISTSANTNYYNVRKKINKTPIMKNIKKGTYTISGSYTGNGETTMTITGLKAKPFMIKITGSYTYTANENTNKTSTYSATLNADIYPSFGDKPYGRYMSYHSSNGADWSLAYSSEISYTDGTFKLTCDSAEYAMNVNKGTYGYTIYYKEGVD